VSRRRSTSFLIRCGRRAPRSPPSACEVRPRYECDLGPYEGGAEDPGPAPGGEPERGRPPPAGVRRDRIRPCAAAEIETEGLAVRALGGHSQHIGPVPLDG